MGGDVLASKIILNLDITLKEKSCMVLTGSYSEKYSFNDTRDGGWKKLIDECGLKVIQSNSLPTAWSFNQTNETPLHIHKIFSINKKYCNAGGGFRTHDLQIMSIAFYGRTVRVYHSNWHSNQAELPRHRILSENMAIKC